MFRSHRPVLLLVTAVVAGLLTAVAGPPAVAGAAPLPTTPGAYVGLKPTRVLDTRTGNGAPLAPVVSGRPLHVTVAGRGGVPAGAAAVVLTLTVVGTHAGGYLTAYPTGGARPTASVVNWATGQTVAGSATVTLGTGGAVDLVVQAGRPVDLVADVSGYTVGGTPTAAGAYVARAPERLLDTRTGNGAPRAPVGAGHTLHVPLAGRVGPGGTEAPSATFTAIVGTLTAVGSRTSGYLTMWGDGDRPTTSALNFAAGQTVANQVTVPVAAADGGINVYAGGGPVDVVLDLTGYVLGGTATEPGTYVALPPARILRLGLAPNQPFATRVPGAGGVPGSDVGAIVANLTVTDTTSSGYLTAWPAGRDQPLASNVNWATGRTVANQASIALGDSGQIELNVSGSHAATVIVDVSGYYLPVPPAAPTGLSVTAASQTSIALQWTAAAGAIGYTVRRATGSVAPAGPTDGVAVSYFGDPPNQLVDVGLTPGTTYSYSVFARDSVPNYSVPATVTAATVPPDTTAPGPDTALHATNVAVTSVTLVWTPPQDSDYANSIVRMTAGTTPPASPTDGTAVGNGSQTTVQFAAGLTSGTTYSFAVFARDTAGNIATTGPAVTVTTLGTAGVTGTTVPLPPGAIDPQKQVTGQDCPPAGSCVVVAGYYDETAARHGQLLIGVVGADGGLTSVPVPLPTTVASFDKPDASVSCAADADCEIVGHYEDDRTGGIVAFAAHWNGTVATSTLLPDVDTDPRAIDCPAAGTCIAVGGEFDGDNERPWVARLAGGSWTDVTVDTAGASSLSALGAVTCASSTSCAAVGDLVGDSVPALVATTTTGTDWTVSDQPAPAGAPGWTTLGRVACPSVGVCMAAGRFPTASGSSSYAAGLLTWRNGTWTTERVGSSTSTDTFDAADVACAAGRCSVLVGAGPASVLLSRPVGGGTWTTTGQSVLPAGATTGSPGLSGLACDTTGRCVGAGSWTDGRSVDHGFVGALSTSQNSATSVEPSVPAQLGGAILGRPVCTDAGRCIATGNYLANTENGWAAAFSIIGG